MFDQPLHTLNSFQAPGSHSHSHSIPFPCTTHQSRPPAASVRPLIRAKYELLQLSADVQMKTMEGMLTHLYNELAWRIQFNAWDDGDSLLISAAWLVQIG